MARTLIASETVPANTPLALEDLTFTAADVANGNSFTYTGRNILLVYNSGGVTYTITPSSIAINGRQDPMNGVAQNVTTLQYVALNFRGEGWKQSDGLIYVSANNAAVKFCMLDCPV